MGIPDRTGEDLTCYHLNDTNGSKASLTKQNHTSYIVEIDKDGPVLKSGESLLNLSGFIG